MSGKDNLNTEEIIKSLAETLDCSIEEATGMIDQDLLKSKDESDETKEDEYSEDKEKEMEKAMNASKEAYETYKAKKPKAEVQKSEEQDLGTEQKPENDDLLKSFGDMFGNFSKNLEEKLEKSQNQAQEQVESLQEELSFMKSQIEEIGNNTPPAKSFGLTNQAIIEKAMDNGVEDGDNVLMSTQVPGHKEKIGIMLGELAEEAQGEMQKSLEIDLSNFVAGGGQLGDTAKRVLKEKRNVVVR